MCFVYYKKMFTHREHDINIIDLVIFAIQMYLAHEYM